MKKCRRKFGSIHIVDRAPPQFAIQDAGLW